MQTVKIKSIKKLDKSYDRYDLRIEKTHNFFANGILIHNTSLVSSKLLFNNKLSLSERVLKFIGFNIQDKEYKYIYSSRKVIKAAGKHTTDLQGFYKDNIWGLAHEKIKHALVDGLSLYCEIVGNMPTGGMIQKDYDYGCREGEFKVFVYRITTTNTSGDVHEFDWASIKEHCDNHEINHVPEYYYGPVNFTLDQLKEKYLEKDCEFCSNRVPGEGIAFRNECHNKKAYKLKSFRFLQKESKDLDDGVSDIETEESDDIQDI